MLSVVRSLVLVLVLVAAHASMAAAQVEPDGRTDQLALLINRARVAQGRLPLARSASLDAAANAHSQDMARANFLDHIGSDDSTPQERAARAGYVVPPDSGWIVVEVISAISARPEGPLSWWLNESPAVHGRVLLDSLWREFGVGYASGGDYGNYWTVLVGCRPGVVPSVELDGMTYSHTEQCGDPSTGAVAPTLDVSSSAGGEVEVRWNGIAAPSAHDWLGVYRPDEPDGDYQAWAYVSCARLALVARAGGWCTLQLPASLADGTYEVRLLADDRLERLAVSEPVSVEASRSSLSKERGRDVGARTNGLRE